MFQFVWGCFRLVCGEKRNDGKVAPCVAMPESWKVPLKKPFQNSSKLGGGFVGCFMFSPYIVIVGGNDPI